MIINEKTIRVIGIVTTILGAGATLVSSWVGEKKMNMKIEQTVADILRKKK